MYEIRMPKDLVSDQALYCLVITHVSAISYKQSMSELEIDRTCLFIPFHHSAAVMAAVWPAVSGYKSAWKSCPACQPHTHTHRKIHSGCSFYLCKNFLLF